MERINEIDRRVLATLKGADKIKALLSDKGLTLKDFAREQGEWVEDVSACIRGERPLPQIRERLAEKLDMARATIDELIDGKAA